MFTRQIILALIGAQAMLAEAIECDGAPYYEAAGNPENTPDPCDELYPCPGLEVHPCEQEDHCTEED